MDSCENSADGTFDIILKSRSESHPSTKAEKRKFSIKKERVVYIKFKKIMEPNELAEGSENLFLRTLSNNDTPKNCEERNRDGDNTDFIEKKDEKCFNNELKDDIMLID